MTPIRRQSLDNHEIGVGDSDTYDPVCLGHDIHCSRLDHKTGFEVRSRTILIGAPGKLRLIGRRDLHDSRDQAVCLEPRQHSLDIVETVDDGGKGLRELAALLAHFAVGKKLPQTRLDFEQAPVKRLHRATRIWRKGTPSINLQAFISLLREGKHQAPAHGRGA